MPHEFAQLGVPWGSSAARQKRLEETLRVVGPLLRGETASFTGEFVQCEGAVLTPPPVQQPSVPLLVAGGGERTTLRFVAEHADACNLGAVGWAGSAYTADDIAHKLSVLDRHCAEVGRPQESVLRTGLLMAVLAESDAAARTKLEYFPAHVLDFFGQLPVVGTPEVMAERLQAQIAAGFHYLIFIVLDAETLLLLGERVLPAIAAS
jgi:alkanesulfonate monooxygenase SsuD/methylene tetrahydromethanopterin reductase-like flavin-dependent oxidoreductase (luciferase family)